MDHPYRTAADRAFWSRSVAHNFDVGTVPDAPPFTFGLDDAFMSAGSCFASNVRRYLESWGCTYTVTEAPHPQWPESEETPYYEAFSAHYGNIYTARQMVQLLERAMRGTRPSEEYWETPEGEFIDPYRPGLSLRAASLAEFRALTRQHLDAVVRAVERSTVLVFTLGLTEAWYSADDGAVFPACPGTVSGTFDPERHRFVNFSVDEITADLSRMTELLRELNPGLGIVLTVSPVPLVATATDRHVLVATAYSKAVLRVAADSAVRAGERMAYFPAYEIVTGPQNGAAFADDLRTVREEAISDVMSAFALAYLDFPVAGGRSTRASADPAAARQLVAQALTDECEEMMADEQIVGRAPAPRAEPEDAPPSRSPRLFGRRGAARGRARG
jgi:hypothetical protein